MPRKQSAPVRLGLNLRQRVKHRLFTLIRPLFVERVDSCEDFFCIWCCEPMLTRALECRRCPKEYE
jgi:hypothetical protein